MPSVQEKIRETEADLERLDRDRITKLAVLSALKSLVSEPVKTMGAAQAIREYLAQRPEGVSTAELTDALEDVIETKSDNRRRIIQNTVNQLKDSGAVKLSKRSGKAHVTLVR